ncbi:RNA polymerase, sigma 28 subunit, Sig B/F/G subfamily [Caldalkalibacillus thermarum TA2.A1]|uniref:RNA polymerase sigma factor SigB n=1 Tax=Caldalkalibacillus thermarum (strain TA2.A1) TaxID=986075 RepID=F5L791_CALTT|nr:RNA polymerase sigma factor SigB [Caldalkalibacillus thermarum]EGL82812.1 RNA polymerase, sigma 28 subunit, Sig B/F/G subfamily [Caldalkalibacillus thermarum TA2.A1]QZT34556.1 RNA polymerase sigma factor SigB [Caldalkalibacillus thermarum TA2.A1]
MTVQSKRHLHNKDDIYRLIEAFQKEPDEEIKTRLVLHFEPLVHSLARKFASNEQVLDDLIQVGMIGLLSALDRYDTSYGRTFESFAVPTIVGEIKRYIRDKTWSVHVPRRIKELAPKIKQAIDDLTTELGRSPQIKEIAQRVEASEEEVLETLEISRSYQALSMDSDFEAGQDGSTVNLLDMVGETEQGYEQVNRRMLLEKLLPVLSEREQQVIRLTFFEGLSQREAGERLNISQMHVSRLQRRALHKLRELLKKTDTLTQSS